MGKVDGYARARHGWAAVFVLFVESKTGEGLRPSPAVLLLLLNR